MAKTGRPKHKQGYKRVTFYLPPAIMEYLKMVGKTQGMSASEYLSWLVTKDMGEEDFHGSNIDTSIK